MSTRILAALTIMLAHAAPGIVGAQSPESKSATEASAASAPAAGPSASTTGAEANAAPVLPPRRASVVRLSGKVRHRLPSAGEHPGAWLLTKVGDELPEGAELETGIRSSVELRVKASDAADSAPGAGQVFTIDRASRVMLREMLRVERTDKTTVDLPYGRVKFDVTSATIANDVQIQAPDACLAVKGTRGLIDVAAGHATEARGIEGNTGVFEVRFGARPAGGGAGVGARPGGGGNHAVTATVRGRESVDHAAPTAAGLALRAGTIDPGASHARQGDERRAVHRLPGGALGLPPGRNSGLPRPPAIR